MKLLTQVGQKDRDALDHVRLQGGCCCFIHLIFAFSGYLQYLPSIGLTSTDSQHATGSQQIARNTPPEKANITAKWEKSCTLNMPYSSRAGRTQKLMGHSEERSMWLGIMLTKA